MKMKADLRKLTYVIMMLCILFMSTSAKAATPRVMISDYKVKGGTVVSGESYELTITLQNESTNTIKNMKVTLSTENGELLPVEGAGTAYVKEIKGGKEQALDFAMQAAYGLEEKSYKLSVKLEYECGGVGYTVDETLFIPVSLNQRVSVTDIYTAEDSYVIGDTGEISAKINNLGSGSLYNVTAKITGDNVAAADSYVGNIEPGKSGTVDLLTKANTVSSETKNTNRILICYEDKSGKQYENEVELNEIRVAEVLYDDFEVVKESKDYSSVVSKVVWGLVILVILAVIIVLLVKRRKKKLAYLDEF